jgi:hypothetical protein
MRDGPRRRRLDQGGEVGLVVADVTREVGRRLVLGDLRNAQQLLLQVDCADAALGASVARPAASAIPRRIILSSRSSCGADATARCSTVRNGAFPIA